MFFTIKKSPSGFTLMEMLLSVAIISILVGISIPINQYFQRRNSLDIDTSAVAQTLRRAQLLAQSGYADSDWGVNIDTGTLTLFKGNNYDLRDTNFDEIVTTTGYRSHAGISRIAFTKFTGYPQTTGTITLTFDENVISSITINEKGTIDY